MDNDWIRPPLLNAWYLSGPTASGKTEIGLELADRIGAEILSLDSMAVYRGMDIGTAKPSWEARRRVPHHLIDIVDPTECYSVSQYVKDAHATAAEVIARGKIPLFVGGTPLYLKTLIRGMFLGPEANWDFRKQIEADLAEFGIESLRARLQQVDPLLAHKLLPGDVRRMTRALEVAFITGKPLSHWQSQFERVHSPDACKLFVLSWERSALHTRVNKRVQAMFEKGLVDEVKGLLDRHQELGRTASQAVGYREVIQHFQGCQSLTDTVPLVQAHTRQFVRRQEIWFRSMAEIQRIPMAEGKSMDSILDAICS